MGLVRKLNQLTSLACLAPEKAPGLDSLSLAAAKGVGMTPHVKRPAQNPAGTSARAFLFN
ncbi:hypothetical protein A3752_26970 [Oleiphilus sp. HI0081]|nr:hypothetical protein A3752_26970 [Oleiphilus sp. HI0081]